ncbi:hypothetical protein [Rhizobium ruizarguesonis]|uniref:hypothetical protein n=1 Tax=Rhizobium ruizarguesonis TaxID=2081791 RepID=UPI0010321567|nr:hypothetical protein [Rhizobium ruizarguesonis]TAZ43704.1 hypothetical protein ELH76_37310 [Rhizobium ruizarguesonis]
MTVVVAVVAMTIMHHASPAQEIEDLALGNDKAALWPFGTPGKTESNGGYTTNDYHLPSGIDFSATFEISTGRLVALGKSWAGAGNGPPAGFGDFRFGKTTLSDIKLRAASSGILYNKVSPVSSSSSGAVEFSAFYDVAASANVVRFVASIDRGALGKLHDRYTDKTFENTGSAATLRSLTISTRDYLERTAGNERVLDLGYKPVSWATPSAVRETAIPAISLARIKPSQLPVFRVYDGPRNFPDFSGRDSKFSTYRTRITNGMTDGPTFAGEYSVIQIGCGTSCSFVYVADNRTGEVFDAPVGGEDNLSLDLKYDVGSRLMISQWGDYDANKCFVQFYSFDDGDWTELLKREVGTLDACLKTVAENIR